MQPVGIRTMNVSIPSILTSLGAKCLLNWVLVFLQRNHMCRSFVGVFSVSLCVADTTLTVVLTTIHLHTNGQLFLLDLRLTRYHICLLVQIVGQIYSALQFPVVVVAGLDHFCTISQRLHPATSRRKWTVHSFVTTLLWFVSTLYVFLVSNFRPVLEDVSHHHIRQCWTFHTFHFLPVALLLLLAVVFASLHRPQFSTTDQSTDLRRAESRRRVTSQSLHMFLNTWAGVILVLALLLLLSVAMPSYLGLNVPWLCFLNSFIRSASSVARPSLHTVKALAAGPPDDFCEEGLNLAWMQRTELEWTKQRHAGNTEAESSAPEGL